MKISRVPLWYFVILCGILILGEAVLIQDILSPEAQKFIPRGVGIIISCTLLLALVTGCFVLLISAVNLLMHRQWGHGMIRFFIAVGLGCGFYFAAFSAVV